ncbi:hypothetical protein [Pseudomonas sp. NBRC 111121]|uniref:hypothetical protein n=1 Tax=Pseudomonas sp. NBRC 111121 TaxID=1661036 RepID=UPI0007613C83|nr:hypothetical protein [Pseudomonas sp. NBRC 111121]
MNTSIKLSTKDKFLTALISLAGIISVALIFIPYVMGYLPQEPAFNLIKIDAYAMIVMYGLFVYSIHLKYVVNEKASRFNVFLSKFAK